MPKNRYSPEAGFGDIDPHLRKEMIERVFTQTSGKNFTDLWGRVVPAVATQSNDDRHALVLTPANARDLVHVLEQIVGITKGKQGNPYTLMEEIESVLDRVRLTRTQE